MWKQSGQWAMKSMIYLEENRDLVFTKLSLDSGLKQRVRLDWNKELG